MIRNIHLIFAIYLMSIGAKAGAQTAVIDLSQTILLEGGKLHFSVITHEAQSTFFILDLIDNKDKLLKQQLIYPSTEVSSYAMTIPVDIPEQAWLVIRNGEATQEQELLILDRPQQLLQQASPIAINASSTANNYMQEESICVTEDSEALVYLSSTDATFKGSLLSFKDVKDFVSYPIKIDNSQVDQVFVLDGNSLKPLPTAELNLKATVQLNNTSAGRTLFAINKLTNLPEKVNYLTTTAPTESAFSKLDPDYKKWLANQLLINDLLTPARQQDEAATVNLTEESKWDAKLGTPTVHLKPQDYVDFDDMKSFLSELARNLKLYPTDIGHGSYIYPIHKKASLRQPLYLINGYIATVDDLLNMKQESITSIKVYTEVKPLVKNLGPVASAGLVLIKTTEKSLANNNIKVGQALKTVTTPKAASPLSPLAYMGSSLHNCYTHNKRLGLFNIHSLSIDDKTLKVNRTQLNITPRPTK